MPNAREMAQEYAKAGFGAAFVMNGGAAVAMLTQASDLIQMNLSDDVGHALFIWALGTAAVPVGWLMGFLSLRFVDRSEQVWADHRKELKWSDGFMFLGVFSFVASIGLFLWGCFELATALAAW